MKKPKKQTPLKGDVGKTLLDLGKLTFGSVFIGGILRAEIPHDILIIAGSVAAVALLFFGHLLGMKKKKKKANSTSHQKRRKK